MWLLGANKPETTDAAEATVPEIPGLETVSADSLARLDALHVQVACIPEPNGSITWYLLSSANEVLQRGNEPTLDDAKLAAIMDAYLPSNEDASPPNRLWDEH